MAFDFEKQNEDWNYQSNFGSTWPKGLLVFALVFLILVIGIKFGFDFLNQRERNTIADYESKIEIAKRNFPIENQKAILNFEKTVRNLKTLLDNRIKTSEFLASIASGTHKEIYFTQFNSNIKENTIKIIGIATNLSVVKQAVIAFERLEGIQKVDVESVRNVSGTTTFTLNLTVNSSFFK